MARHPGRPPLSAWTRLALIGLGSATVPLDSALNVAFPAIGARFGLAVPEIQWIIICYVLTYGSLVLGIGRLGDLYGHARVFRLGLAWSVVAFLLCAAAPSYAWLLPCRIAQGIGAALVIACGPALVTSLFPEAMRSRVLGLYALMFSAGSVLGPSLGGVLTGAFGWPAVFWFRAPIALAALLLLRGLPAPPPRAEAARFDLAGAVLLAVAIGAALLAVNQARDPRAGVPLLLLAVASGWGFLRRSRASASPIIALHVFRVPGFAAIQAAAALVNMAGFAVLLFVPFYLARIAALPVAVSGLVLAASAVAMMTASAAGGWLLLRWPARRLVALAVALTTAGLGLIALWGAGTGLPVLVGALALHGAGLGLLQVGSTDLAAATLPRADRGVAGSLAMLMRTLGVVSAASLLTLAFGALEGAGLAGGAAAPDAFLAAFRGSFLLAAAICGGTLMLLLRVR